MEFSHLEEVLHEAIEVQGKGLLHGNASRFRNPRKFGVTALTVVVSARFTTK